MAGEFSLDKLFWRTFTSVYWNRKPVVLRAPFPKPIVSAAEVFRAAVAAARRLREPTDDVALIAGKHRVVLRRELRRWLPRSRDASLHGYLDRLRAAGAGREVAFFVSDFQVELGWTVFGRLREFLADLYRFVGVPAVRAELDLFFGNYRRTRTGVHRDSADVFCIVVQGRKRIRAWPARALDSGSPNTGPASYADFLPHSVVLEGGPGDILYWPSSYWHIAESDGRAGSSLSLGLYYGGSLGGALSDTLQTRPQEMFGNDPQMRALPFTASGVAARLAPVAARAERAARPLTGALLRHWIERISACGFARLPQPSGRRSPRLGKRLCAEPGVPILYVEFHGKLLVSANGRSVVVPFRREVLDFLRTLSRGGSYWVDAVPAPQRRKSQEPLRRAVRFLSSANALRSV
jgi:50S ribosomal protein L16 3-hydroxylase